LSYYSKGRTHLEFLPELVPPEGASLREQVHALTQQFADIVGAAARAHPTDWHMLQPVWTADLDRRGHEATANQETA
jgi:lauroyl/myristoyl acyltransferase